MYTIPTCISFWIFFIFDKKSPTTIQLEKWTIFFQILSVCTCARNMYILGLAGCAPKETCEIALKMRECCQQSCKLCCKMTKMMAFNLDDYFPLCPFHVPSGIPVEFHIVLVEFWIILVECCQQSCKLFCKMT